MTDNQYTDAAQHTHPDRWGLETSLPPKDDGLEAMLIMIRACDALKVENERLLAVVHEFIAADTDRDYQIYSKMDAKFEPGQLDYEVVERRNKAYEKLQALNADGSNRVTGG